MKIKIIALVILLTGSASVLLLNSGSSQLSAKPFVHSASDTINWKAMDHAERKAYMKQVVMPAMRTEFSSFNPRKFAEMNCSTCHDEGSEDDSYKMPNPEIYKLPNSKEGWAKADTNFMKFMRFTVKPKMASLLGLAPYDKDHQNGFGCGNCHTDEK